jgi:hypothetical protein
MLQQTLFYRIYTLIHIWRSKLMNIKLNPEDYAIKEQQLVEMFNAGILTHKYLLKLLKEKYYGVGKYCRWMEYIGLRDQVEPEYARQYFQNRSAT